MKEKKVLIDKYCKLETTTGLNLYGYPTEITANGVFFETDQKSSFINWSEIRFLVPVRME